MNPRVTCFWLLLAAVLAGLVFINTHYSGKSGQGPQVLLPQLKPPAVTSIRIKTAAAPEFLVERTNDEWKITRPFGYPAQGTSIDAFLNQLQRLTPATLITASELKDRPKADEEFGFANPQASIVIQQGDVRHHLLIGNRTAPGDQFFLQVLNVEGIYVVDADFLKRVPKTADDWRETTFLNLKGLAFDRLTVTNAGKLFVELQRETNTRVWRLTRPLPLRADTAKIEQALDKLQAIRVLQFVPEEPKPDLEAIGFQPADLELAFTQGANLVELVQFGKTNATGQLYARRVAQNTLVTIPGDSAGPWRAPVNDFRDQHLLVLDRTIDSIEAAGDDNFTIQRQTNGTWRILPGNFTADAPSLTELFSTLNGLRTIDFVQDVVTESGLAAYGLASPRRRYVLRGSISETATTNQVLAALHFGTNQGNRVFVRRTDETSVYAISSNDFQRLPAMGWQLRDRQLWNIAQDDLAGATIRKDGKACQLVRKEQYKWSFAPGSQGVIKDELPLEETMRGLESVRALAWVARGDQDRARYGLSEGSLQVTLELKSGEKSTVQFGGEASPNSVYASITREGSVWILEFPWLLFRDMLNYLPIP